MSLDDKKIIVMARKARHFYKYLLVSFLTLIGFSSCSKADLEQGPEEEIWAAYGTPAAVASVRVKANVLDSSGSPVQGARLKLRYGKDSRAMSYYLTHYDLVPSETHPGWYDQLIVDSTDMTGSLLGLETIGSVPDTSNTYIVFHSSYPSIVTGKYESDSVKVVPVKIKDGDGANDLGFYEVEGTLRLKEKTADSE